MKFLLCFSVHRQGNQLITATTATCRNNVPVLSRTVLQFETAQSPHRILTLGAAWTSGQRKLVSAAGTSHLPPVTPPGLTTVVRF